MIKIEDVQLTFNAGTPIENCVLQQVNLCIDEGEFVTVVGSNGAGKSSLLNIISGDLKPDTGYIIINDRDVTHQSTWQRADFVARVFQDPMTGTCEKLTIEENLALAYRRGKNHTFYPALTDTLRKLLRNKLTTLHLNLENRLHHLMGQLSGGQRQAVSLFMASLQHSRILLLDEHTAALDPKTAEFILNLTDAIVKKNKLTTMMVTHSMQDALTYGTRTIMLHQGRIVLDISGPERSKLTVARLLKMFEKMRGETISDDALLLN